MLLVGTIHLKAYVFDFYNHTPDTLNITFKLAGLFEQDNPVVVNPKSRNAVRIEGIKIGFCLDTFTLKVNGQAVTILDPLYADIYTKLITEAQTMGKVQIDMRNFAEKLGACHNARFDLVLDTNDKLWAIVRPM